jgi:hypothetical protein
MGHRNRSSVDLGQKMASLYQFEQDFFAFRHRWMSQHGASCRKQAQACQWPCILNKISS